MKEINGNKETLKRNLLDLIELQQILLKTQNFFEEVRGYTLYILLYVLLTPFWLLIIVLLLSPLGRAVQYTNSRPGGGTKWYREAIQQ